VAGVGQHGGWEAADVVRAQQPPRLAVVEGEVEQRLVAPALDQLGVAAPGPGRLADAEPRSAARRGHELAPGGDDARGIAAEALHVGEAHAVDVGPEPSAQQRDLVLGHGREDRAAAVDRLAEIGHQPGEILLVARVEDRLVVEAAQASPIRSHARASCP
jgi:hypothetical protein